MQKQLSIESNRLEKKYSTKEYLLRILWGLGFFIFRLSPRPLFSFRAFLLRLYGAKIGKHVHIYPSAKILFPWNLEIGEYSAIAENVLIYNLGTLKIGDRTTISHGAQICGGTHDYSCSTLPLIRSNITIGDDVWICTEAFVGPRSMICQGAIIAARAVVLKDVKAFTIVGGNPAKFIKKREIK